MATWKEKRDAVKRYQSDPRIDITERAIFTGATVFDRGQIAVMAIATAVFGSGTLAMHFQQSSVIDKIKDEAAAVPTEIHDLGERMTVADQEETSIFQTDLRNAARYVLSQEPRDIRNLTLTFSARGNTVFLEAAQGEAAPARVDARHLADAYREKLETRAEIYRDSRNSTDQIGGVLTAGLAFFGIWAWRNSRERVQRALDHYNIK